MTGDTREEALEKWWAKWRAEDFTWEGLAKKPLQGWVVAEGFLREAKTGRVYGNAQDNLVMPVNERDATLQDYWRADPTGWQLRADDEMSDELHVVEGQPTYHVVHLPILYGDGEPTGKADWPDDFLDLIVLTRLVVAKETSWQRTSRGREIVGSDFDAQFQGGVWLKAETPWKNLRSVSLHIRREWSATLGFCHLESAEFPGYARFANAVFEKGAFFERAVFAHGADFKGVLFAETALFNEVSFGGTVSFEGVNFISAALFQHTHFALEANFEEATFGNEAMFSDARFLHRATFLRAKFVGAAVIDAVFDADAHFHSARFSGVAHFNKASFSKRAVFNGCSFDGPLSFSDTTFEFGASFVGLSWPEDSGCWHSAFDGAKFVGRVSFEGAGFRCLAAFNGATFEGGLVLDAVEEKAAKSRFRMERTAAVSASVEDGEVFLGGEKRDATRKEVAAHVRKMREVRLHELECGCRVLKEVFHKAADRSREQMLYQFESQARRAQRGLPAGEALFSDLYAFTSDYGASMVRPFVSLGILLLAFAATFFGFAEIRGLGSGNPIADAWQAFDFSLTNVFRPLSALSSEAAVHGSLAERLLTQAGYGWTTGVRALAILQSILAIVLAFLFALAVRRRFQIS